MPLVARLEPGRIFAGEYRVLGLLAEGGMGTVYRAEQLSTRKARALKLVHARIAADPKGRERFVREATVGAAIASDHVVEVIAAGVDEATDQPWLAMELLDGADLGSLVEHRGPLDPAQAFAVLQQLCHGLGAAHRAGIVHRDLKPANIFVARSRRAEAPFTVKILDFGIAKLVEASKSGATETETVGSPMWMAPEQLNAQRPTPATDVWSLGLIAFWTITGRHYWRAAHLRDSTVQALFVEQLFKALDPASVRAAELGAAGRLPDSFDAWFRRCVAREPDQRWSDGEAALAGLADALPSACSPGDLHAVLPETAVPSSASGVAAVLERGPTWAAGATERDVEDLAVDERPSSAANDPTIQGELGSEPLGADLSRADLDPPRPSARSRSASNRTGVYTGALALAAILGGASWWAVARGPFAAREPDPVDLPRIDEPVPEQPDPRPRVPIPEPLPMDPPTPEPDPQPEVPAVELVVPLRTQPSFATHDVRVLGWTSDARRFVLQATHEDGETAGGGELELVQVHDVLTGAMIESYVVEPAGRIRTRHRGKLRRMADEAKPFAEWEIRREALGLVSANARHAPVGDATLEIEADAAPVPTTITTRATARGFSFRWEGLPALVPMGDEGTRGPHMRTILVDDAQRWELLDIRPPFTVGDVAARADASGNTPAIVGRIDLYWSPDERRVLMVTKAQPEPAIEDELMRDARWFLRAVGPQIRVVEAGAGQRLAREIARELEAAGLPTASVDLREPVVGHSEIYYRAAWPGARELAERMQDTIDRPLSIEAVKGGGWTTAVVVLGQDLAD